MHAQKRPCTWETSPHPFTTCPQGALQGGGPFVVRTCASSQTRTANRLAMASLTFGRRRRLMQQWTLHSVLEGRTLFLRQDCDMLDQDGKEAETVVKRRQRTSV